MAIISTMAHNFESGDAAGLAKAMRRVMRRAMAALDRLLPPDRVGRRAEPPPEWFMYPPF
jgi:hypothetical protein